MPFSIEASMPAIGLPFLALAASVPFKAAESATVAMRSAVSVKAESFILPAQRRGNPEESKRWFL